MYKTKNGNRNNICGEKIKEFRLALEPPVSQHGLADLMQTEGVDFDKNAVQRIEAGQRFVTDIEIKVLAKVLKVSYEQLLDI